MIYLVRHGLTEWNRKRILQGRLDSPLAEEGRATAAALGRALATKGIRKIYTSNLGRCMQVSEIINNSLHVPVIAASELGEQDFGEYNGMPSSDVRSRMDVDDLYAVPPGGESLEAVKHRVIKFLKALHEDDVLIVTHNGCMQMVLSEQYGVPHTDPRCNIQPNVIACIRDDGSISTEEV